MLATQIDYFQCPNFIGCFRFTQSKFIFPEKESVSSKGFDFHPGFSTKLKFSKIGKLKIKITNLIIK